MKLNLKNLKYFRQGIHSITPLQLSNARISGYWGTLVGLLLAAIPIVISKNWWWLVLMFFVFFLQTISLIGELQTKKNLKEAESQINAVTEAFEKSGFKKEMNETQEEL